MFSRVLSRNQLYELFQHLNNRQSSSDGDVLETAIYCNYVQRDMPDLSIFNHGTIQHTIHTFEEISSKVLTNGINMGRIITIYMFASKICNDLKDEEEVMQIAETCHNLVRWTYNRHVLFDSIPYIILSCLLIKVF